MTAAIFYEGEAYTTSGPKLMGRNAAGESFLRGFAQHSTADRFHVQATTPQAAQPFVDVVRAAGRQEPIDVLARIVPQALAGPGALYYPALPPASLAWERSHFGDAAWSLCGVTHTTASANAMDGIAALLTAPFQPWDAMICPSSAVHANVLAVLDAQADFLTRRMGATAIPRPQLPVIPLGTHCDDFAFDADARAAARMGLGIDDDVIVVLYTGRLSFHAKAHPAAMYAALEQAADGHRVMLIECGWFPNDTIAASFATASTMLCPSVTVRRIDGRLKDQRQAAWACADIFCSLSDNIQETFGLTPIEAMAAGLPVVVSDWDGYRDTVRDGIDGFRIPTLMPGAGLGGDLALRHAMGIDTYDRYCGYTGAFVAVDIGAAARAFAALFDSPDLRRRMGAAGQARARSVYDWAAIIPRYEALWDELAAIRARAGGVPPAPWPARLDPFAGFATYPTATLSPGTRFALTDSDVAVAKLRMRAMAGLDMVGYAANVLPTLAEAEALIDACASGPCTAADMVAGIVPERRAFVFRGIAWLTKQGVISVFDESKR